MLTSEKNEKNPSPKTCLSSDRVSFFSIFQLWRDGPAKTKFLTIFPKITEIFQYSLASVRFFHFRRSPIRHHSIAVSQKPKKTGENSPKEPPPVRSRGENRRLTSKSSCGVRRQKTQPTGFAVTKRFTTLVWLSKNITVLPPLPPPVSQREKSRIDVKNGTLWSDAVLAPFFAPSRQANGRQKTTA
jgi:hypothetical protein